MVFRISASDCLALSHPGVSMKTTFRPLPSGCLQEIDSTFCVQEKRESSTFARLVWVATLMNCERPSAGVVFEELIGRVLTVLFPDPVHPMTLKENQEVARAMRVRDSRDYDVAFTASSLRLFHWLDVRR